MTQLASDNFQRPDENPLSNSGNWANGGFQRLNPVQLVSHLIQPTSANIRNGSRWIGLTWPNDQYSEVTLNGTPGAYCGPAVRCGSAVSTSQCYCALLDGSGTVFVQDYAGTAFASGPYTPVANDVIRIEAQGTAIR